MEVSIYPQTTSRFTARERVFLWCRNWIFKCCLYEFQLQDLVRHNRGWNVADLRPGMRNYYHSCKMSLWLNLFPLLHRPGEDDLNIWHHHFQEEVTQFYVGETFWETHSVTSLKSIPPNLLHFSACNVHWNYRWGIVWKKMFVNYIRKTNLQWLTKQNAGVEQIRFLKTSKLMTTTVTIIMTNTTA